jgi:hypothetical protein
VPRQLPLTRLNSRDHFWKRKIFWGLIFEEIFWGDLKQNFEYLKGSETYLSLDKKIYHKNE